MLTTAALDENKNANTQPRFINPATGMTSTKAGVMLTTIDPAKLQNATDLSIARTLIHEFFHTIMTTAYSIYPMRFPRKDKPFKYDEVFPTYDTLVNNHGTSYDIAQHEQLAEPIKNMRKDIADMLEKYGKSKGYAYLREYYEDMAWGGLTTTSYFLKLPIDEQNRINRILIDAQIGNINDPPPGKKACQ